jgi:hypothetical protein
MVQFQKLTVPQVVVAALRALTGLYCIALEQESLTGTSG